jgi:hypothetical protein
MMSFGSLFSMKEHLEGLSECGYVKVLFFGKEFALEAWC